jgi:nicotinamidase/pyrazinamidase
VEALIVVDVQNDFCPGGALAVTDGDQVVDPINELAEQVGFVVATRDWHPLDHSSFAAQGGPWPVHCVQGSSGAELHPGVRRDRIDVVVDKGQVSELDGYSGFQGTELDRLLRERGVDTVHVAGLALDYCVKETALDARRAGYEVVLHRRGTRPVEVQAGDGERAVEELRAAGVEVAE